MVYMEVKILEIFLVKVEDKILVKLEIKSWPISCLWSGNLIIVNVGVKIKVIEAKPWL